MTTEEYVPPKIWTWNKESGGRFASINRPIAGPTHEKELPVGQHPLQLYSLATPNGVKVTVMLEELLAAGHKGAEYDAWLINIQGGDQFGSGFVAVNPNSKIPALLDRSTPKPTRIFESGSILLYLAQKFGAFLPKEHHARTEALNWLFWQMGSAPYLGGGFGHFYAYAPVKIEYAIDPLRDGSEAPARRARPQSRRARMDGGRRIFDRRYGGRTLVWRSRERQLYEAGEFLEGASLQARQSLDGRVLGAARRPARAQGQTAPGASPAASCSSATTHRTSTPRRWTRCRRRRADANAPRATPRPCGAGISMANTQARPNER